MTTTMSRASSARAMAVEAKYRRLVVQHEQSGLTIREFAKRVGIPAGTLSFWRFKLKTRERERAKSAMPSLLPVQVKTSGEELDTARTNVLERGSSPGYEVLLRCGRVVRLSGSFEVESLQALVRALEATC